MKAWLSLGSNLDNPFMHLERALAYMQDKCYIKILRCSEAVLSKPFGFTDQPDFANQVVEVETILKLDELFAFVKCAELDLGRKPTFKWGPRIIDLDILFYENVVIATPDLIVPHPGIPYRGYLLSLLNSMIPDYMHPELKVNIAELHSKFLTQGV
jgi:2-amino-4-hydroxy-6-hydroxymethyldihydropteridine diphosphokinase